MSFRVRPNFTWIVEFVLICLWWFGILSGPIAFGLFFIYILVSFCAMMRNPQIMKEAELFRDQVMKNRLERKVSNIKNQLQEAVELRRK